MMEHAEHSPAAIREKAAGAVNCQSVTLPSGLTVLCRTMPGYSSVHAMYATNSVSYTHLTLPTNSLV